MFYNGPPQFVMWRVFVFNFVRPKNINYVEWNEKAGQTYNAMFDKLKALTEVLDYNLQLDIFIYG